VRVIRGRNPGSLYAPAGGFRYNGHYHVDEYWQWPDLGWLIQVE
jgi:hypothetical protein